MDITSFLIGSLVILVAVILGAGIAAIITHLNHHAVLSELREQNSVLVRESPSPPRHAERYEMSYSAQPAVETSERPKPAARPARTRADAIPTEEVPPLPTSSGSISKLPGETTVSVPVDVTFSNRAGTRVNLDDQRRGGN